MWSTGLVRSIALMMSLAIVPESIRVGVLAGGISHERAGSLASARAVTDALSRLGHRPVEIDLADPNFLDSLNHIDCAFVAAHGWYGEDGKLQGALELLGIPYTGSGVLANAIGLWKPTFKQVLSAAAIPTPRWESVDCTREVRAEAQRLADALGFPQLLKPASGGGSLGVHLARSTRDLSALLSEIRTGLEWTEYMAEEYVDGVDLSVGILDGTSGPEPLPILLTTHDRPFYDYRVKHDSALRRHECPALLGRETYDLIQEWAVALHSLCFCRGVSRVDLIMAGDEPRVLEINTVPGLSREGNLATMARAAEMSYERLILAILATAYNRPRYSP